MGIHVLANPGKGLDFDHGQGREIGPINLPLYASDDIHESDDHLGCMRGIAVAFALQAVVALVVFALWRIF